MLQFFVRVRTLYGLLIQLLKAPVDVLAVITHINRNGAGATDPSVEPGGYYDVNGDGFVAAIDALRVIQHLNRVANA